MIAGSSLRFLHVSSIHRIHTLDDRYVFTMQSHVLFLFHLESELVDTWMKLSQALPYCPVHALQLLSYSLADVVTTVNNRDK